MIRLTPPTVPGYASSGWGAPREYRKGIHAGVDFPAAKGSPILAAADGTVVFVKNYSNSFAGKYPVVDHGGGVLTRYLHADNVTAQVGQRVRRGDQLGTVGTTGTSRSAPHVHFDVKLTPEAMTAYTARFGQPPGGFSPSLTVAGRSTRGAPAETFLDNVDWKPAGLAQSIAKGVVFYKPGATSFLVGATLAAGFGLYKYVFK